MDIIALASPKGGVGKTTTAVQLARVLSETHRVLLVDADHNRSGSVWTSGMDAAFHTVILDSTSSQDIARLRASRKADVAILDLPGTEEAAAWQAVMSGPDGRPVADLLVIPSQPGGLSLPPVVRFIRQVVEPLGARYLLAATLVDSRTVTQARDRLAELRDMGVEVAHTISRIYAPVSAASERHTTVLDIGGPSHTSARHAESDARALAAEIMAALAR